MTSRGPFRPKTFYDSMILRTLQAALRSDVVYRQTILGGDAIPSLELI